jgi:hypothetical protein
MKLLTKLLTLAGQLLTLACVHSLPPSSPDAEAIRELEAAWGLAGLPALGTCLERIEVRRHDTRESYVDACDGMRPGLFGDAASKSAGCLTTELHGVMGTQVAVIEVAPGYHADMGLVQHEAAHRAYQCAFGHTDPLHRDARVWSGVLGRAKPPN